ncbi:immune inhibitor A domain-containing protein [Streptomyces anandii]|uniref:immune inhibitor A domain-containing protein n=1 Tax=Streptomyces anandii TaxID=285454 RepID=UPI003697A647
MRRPSATGLLAALTTSAIAAALLGSPAVAQEKPSPPEPAAAAHRAMGAEGPQPPVAAPAHRQQALRAQAMQRLNSGTLARTSDGRAPARAKIGDDYVPLARQRTDKVFVILAQFGDKVDDSTLYNGHVRYGGTPGPRHDQIPRPGRDDTHTYWEPDFSKSYYQKMFFDDTPGANSVRNYYRTQSAGRYDIQGTVSDWVTVPYNEARYGSDKGPEGNGAWTQAQEFIRDAVDAWYKQQRADGRSDADIKAQLAQYDTTDRYDANHDGNFAQPDGYLDNVIVVHAGVDQTWGGGAQGDDALWAHRAWDFPDPTGTTGPAGAKLGGAQVGDTGMYVYDYVQAGENSGVGLFSHEYGHNLGLPDLYPLTGGDNSVNFWSLMSSGSYLGRGRNTTGEYPGDLDPYSKLQLGWLDYDEAQAATRSRHVLGVSAYNTRHAQATLVHLPDGRTETDLADPYQGTAQWWSGTGDNLDSTLDRTVDLAGRTGPAALDTAAWYDTEPGYDFFSVEASTDAGKTWTALGGTVNGAPIGNTTANTPGLSGSSGTWAQLHIPLDAYVGQQVRLRFHVTSDGNTHGKGVLVDAVRVTAGADTILDDGAETGGAGWTSTGFRVIQGRVAVEHHARAYLVENRRYAGYGTFLRTGPYNFGYSGVAGKTNVIDTYPYQQGVLVWLWDTAYSDNNTADHPGHGLILPVDAHPTQIRFADGTAVNARAQSFDAPFSLHRTTPFALHKAGVRTWIRSEPGVPYFDDHTGVYTDPAAPQLGVSVPDTGTRVTVLHESDDDDLTTTVQVSPSS